MEAYTCLYLHICNTGLLRLLLFTVGCYCQSWWVEVRMSVICYIASSSTCYSTPNIRTSSHEVLTWQHKNPKQVKQQRRSIFMQTHAWLKGIMPVLYLIWLNQFISCSHQFLFKSTEIMGPALIWLKWHKKQQPQWHFQILAGQNMCLHSHVLTLMRYFPDFKPGLKALYHF